MGLQKERREQAAMEQYRQTGDPNVLLPAMTPQQAYLGPSTLAGKNAEVMKNAADFMDTWLSHIDETNYEPFREFVGKKLGSEFMQAMPPLDTIKDFPSFKEGEKIKTARAKAFYDMQEKMRSPTRVGNDLVIPGGPSGPQLLYRAPAVPKEWAPQLVDTETGPKPWVPGQPPPPGTTGRLPTVKELSPDQAATAEDWRLALESGKYKKGEYLKFKADMAAGKAGAVKEAQEGTETGQLRKDKLKAEVQIKEEAFETGQRLRDLLGVGPGGIKVPEKPSTKAAPTAPAKVPPKPGKSPYELYNKRTGKWDTLSKADYDRIVGKR
jgi:hypothetical protein